MSTGLDASFARIFGFGGFASSSIGKRHRELERCRVTAIAPIQEARQRAELE